MTVPVPLQRLASTLLGVLATVVLMGLGLDGDLWALAWVGYAPVGVLILWKRPENRIGWVCIGIGTLLALSDWLQHAFASPSTPSGVIGLQLGSAVGALSFVLLIVLVAIFPTGRPYGAPSRAVLWFAAVVAPVITIASVLDSDVPQGAAEPGPLAVPALAAVTGLLLGVGFLLVPLALALACVDVYRRWRAGRGVERQQLRWFLAAIPLLVVVLVTIAALNPAEDVSVAWSLVLIPAAAGLPASIGVAITRYRLYELDRVVSRSVSYAVVTGLLVATYAVVVTSASRLFGDTSTLAVALATLVAAALFQPLLRRVQRVVDRRFNRQRVDHERAVDDFAARLRDQLDEVGTSADLVRVAARTLEPVSARLWLREPSS